MELVLKYTTAFCPSPKKFKVELKGEDETILLEELKKKEEYEQVSIKVKVLEVMDCATVPTEKCCHQSNYGVYVQENLHGHFLVVLHAVGPTSSRVGWLLCSWY